MKDIQRYLHDLMEQIQDIEEFVVDGRDVFMSDRKTQKAVIRSYEIIGEILKRLPAELLAQYPVVEWQQIKGFRDFLIHNYNRVSLLQVWGAVEKLPVLKAAVLEMTAHPDLYEPPEN